MKSRWIFYKMRPLFMAKNILQYSTCQTLVPSLDFGSICRRTSFPFNHVEISRLLSDCGREGKLHLGSTLHAWIIKNLVDYEPRNYINYRNSIVVWNSLLSMYFKNQELQKAVKVFDKMPMRDTISWNTVISGYLTNGHLLEGFSTFKQMHESGIDQFDQATFTTILASCGELQLLSFISTVHSLVICSGYMGEVTVGNALVTSYFECGCTEEGKKVFYEMRERNVVTWTAIISGLAQNKIYEDCLELFREMGIALVVPNSLTYLALLSACSGLQARTIGQQIHGIVLQLGLHSNLRIESALMDMYSKCGLMEEALQIFYAARKIDVVSMTIILAGLAQNGLEDEAVCFFLKMVRAGVVDPNMVSATLGMVDTSLSVGQQIHSLAVKKSFISNPFVSNGLINMYSKCGVLRESAKVFNRMPVRNSVSWNSMIAAFARHGDGFTALRLYKEMMCEEICRPTDVTFLSLLHACSHMGLIEKGMEFIESMTKAHKIIPRMEHYACIVDMLGRAGLLQEAKIFIEELPASNQGAVVWQAFLGACCIRSDPEMGKYAAEKLLSLAPESPSPYIQLANIYSSRGKWRERARTLKRMKEMGMTKETGISWVEIEKSVHSFVVGDEMHPRAEIIYGVLRQLFWHMRDEGYLLLPDNI